MQSSASTPTRSRAAGCRLSVGFPAPFSLGIGLVFLTLAIITVVSSARDRAPRPDRSQTYPHTQAFKSPCDARHVGAMLLSMTATVCASEKTLAATSLTGGTALLDQHLPRESAANTTTGANAPKASPTRIFAGWRWKPEQTKRGNVEGSAAFACFAPSHRKDQIAVRAQVALQSAYDYVDTLCEQPNAKPVANGSQLHRALLSVALDQDARTHADYYASYAHHNDAGSLEQIIDACRSSLATLPSNAAITGPFRRLTERIVVYQSLNLSELHGGHRQLQQWALDATPPTSSLGSVGDSPPLHSCLSLHMLALILTARARPAFPPR